MSLRIVVPFVPGRLNRFTKAWGENREAEFRDVSCDREAYFRLLAELWADGRAFMVVEHDNVPPAGAVEQLAACPEPWCGYAYIYDPVRALAPLEGELGCTRFSAGLLRMVPQLIEETCDQFFGLDYARPRPVKDWRWLYHRVRLALMRHGVGFHAHLPHAIHLHPQEHLDKQIISELLDLAGAMRFFTSTGNTVRGAELARDAKALLDRLFEHERSGLPLPPQVAQLLHDAHLLHVRQAAGRGLRQEPAED